MSDHDAYLGIDLGGTHVRWAVVDRTGGVLSTRSRVLPPDPAARATVPEELAAAHRGRVAGIGLAVAGTVTDGVLTWSANLGLHDVDFAGRLTASGGVPAVVLNDARAAGYAEARVGAGAGAASVLAVTVGTGIGGAIIIDERLIAGTGDAGEIGHLVIDPAGPPCGCGRRGCWETFVGGRALARAAAERYPDAPDPLARLIALAEAGDPTAGAVVDGAATRFALGLDNLCAVLAPAVIVLGGGVMARDGLIARRYRAAAGTLRWGARSAIRDSRLGDTAGQIGAALAAYAAGEPNQ